MNGNVAVFDECKGSNNTLLCFAGIVFRNKNVYDQVKREVEKLKSKYKSLNQGEIKSKSLKPSNKDLIEYLDGCFNFLVGLAYDGYIKIHFHFMYSKDYFYDTANLKNNLIDLFKQTTSLQDDDEIEKSTYWELDCFLVKYLDELHFPGDVIKSIYCDNVYRLLYTNEDSVIAEGNIFESEMKKENISAIEVQSLHNSLNQQIHKNISHQGLEEMVYLDSKENVIVQLCDFLASCIYNSITYLFCEKHGFDSSKYKYKYEFISKYITNIDSIDVDLLNLSYDKDTCVLTCNGKFINIDGIVIRP